MTDFEAKLKEAAALMMANKFDEEMRRTAFFRNLVDQEIKRMSRDSKSSYYDEGGIEVFDVIRAKLTPEQFEGYLLGNAIKYSLRLNWKGTKGRDAEKMRNYATWFSEMREPDEEICTPLSVDTMSAANWGTHGVVFVDAKEIPEEEATERCVLVVDGQDNTVGSIPFELVRYKLPTDSFHASVWTQHVLIYPYTMTLPDGFKRGVHRAVDIEVTYTELRGWLVRTCGEEYLDLPGFQPMDKVDGESEGEQVRSRSGNPESRTNKVLSL